MGCRQDRQAKYVNWRSARSCSSAILPAPHRRGADTLCLPSNPSSPVSITEGGVSGHPAAAHQRPVARGLYALIAVGYTVVYGIIQLINFAHGEIFMIGAFGALTAWILMPGESLAIWVLPIMLVAGMVAAVGVSLLTERFAYRPLRNAPRLAPLITAIGVSVFLQEFVRLFYGRIPGFPDARRAIPFPQIDYVTGPAIQLVASPSSVPRCSP